MVEDGTEAVKAECGSVATGGPDTDHAGLRAVAGASTGLSPGESQADC